MHVLIFDGTPEAAQKGTMAAGGRSNEALFQDALQSQEPRVRTFTLNVADGERLPQGIALADFDGVVITGSPLSVYEDKPAVRDQLELARAVFDAGIPSFGSCWGLQLMTATLGGSVRLNPRGREIGIARTIILNDAGRRHPLYAGKPHAFDAFCSHQDEVETLPEGSCVLAGNAVSTIQAAEICQGERCFWGVQYHPEFDFVTIAARIERGASRHIKEGRIRSQADAVAMADEFRALGAAAEARPDLLWKYGLGADVVDAGVRRAEFGNWLATKVAPYVARRA